MYIKIAATLMAIILMCMTIGPIALAWEKPDVEDACVVTISVCAVALIGYSLVEGLIWVWSQ